MKRENFGLKTKVGICMLVFSFILLPIFPTISMAEDKGDAEEENDRDKAGYVLDSDSAAGAAQAAAQAGGAGGLSAKQKALLVAAGLLVVGGVIAASDDDDAVAPTTEHP